MKVSAVIPVYNGEKFIAECIESLLNQTEKFDEIILVDDGSTDRTAEIAKKYPIKIMKNPHLGRSKTRNAGLDKVKNEIIFFVEADAVYSKNFLEECKKFFSDPRVGGVIGKLEVKNINDSVWTKCRAAELDSRFANYTPFTGWMYRSEIIKKIGGFDTSLDIGEDVLLGEKVISAGYNIAYAQNAQWRHLEPASIKKIWTNSWNRGVEIIKKYRKSKFPKIMVIDFLAIFSFFAGFWNLLFFLVPLIYAFAQIFVRRRQFLYIEKKYWLHLIFYLMSNIFIFKIGRFAGLAKVF